MFRRRRRRRKGGIAKTFVLEKVLKKRSGLVQLQASIPFYKTALACIASCCIKRFTVTPKKNYSYSALTLYVPGGFFDCHGLRKVSLWICPDECSGSAFFRAKQGGNELHSLLRFVFLQVKYDFKPKCWNGTKYLKYFIVGEVFHSAGLFSIPPMTSHNSKCSMTACRGFAIIHLYPLTDTQSLKCLLD